MGQLEYLSGGDHSPSAARGQFASMRDWFSTELGSQLLRTERAILDQLLNGIFGYHLLQLGVVREDLHDGSPVGHKIRMGQGPGEGTPCIADFYGLPFASDSLDIVLVQHVLDICHSPQQILREASRVTIPSGYLVIVGFNPFSTWGLWNVLRFWDRQAPFNVRYVRPGRLMDWLTLLGFKIDRAIFGYYRPPTARFLAAAPDFSQGLSRHLNWPFGAIYIIVARKQVAGMTPLRPVWRRHGEALGNLSAVRPARRNARAGQLVFLRPDAHQDAWDRSE